MVKGASGAKVKVFIQGLHMTYVILASVYNLKFFISDTPFVKGVITRGNS
jgi:hypothetical protein